MKENRKKGEGKVEKRWGGGSEFNSEDGAVEEFGEEGEKNGEKVGENGG